MIIKSVWKSDKRFFKRLCLFFIFGCLTSLLNICASEKESTKSFWSFFNFFKKKESIADKLSYSFFTGGVEYENMTLNEGINYINSSSFS